MTCDVSSLRARCRAWQHRLLVLTTLLYLPACAQTGGAPDHSVPGGTTPVVVGESTFSDIERLVASIALYPDDLLAIVLPASSYPLQIVQAARFLDAVEQDPARKPDETWDDSVVALLNYPEVVRMMNDDLDWTWRLGQAVLAQQADVIAAIEDFRDRAYAAGNLQSDARQVVGRDHGAIYIRPADPQVIYVPYYEPTRVIVRHARPVYHYYPRAYPVYYYPYPVGQAFSSGFFFGVTTYYTLGWNTRHLYRYDYDYHAHPFYGRPTVYHRHHYYYRQPRKVVHNHYYDARDRNHQRREDHRWRHDGRTYDRGDWERRARERRNRDYTIDRRAHERRAADSARRGGDDRAAYGGRPERDDRLTRMAQSSGAPTAHGERRSSERVQRDPAQQRQRVERPAAAARADTLPARAHERARAAEPARGHERPRAAEPAGGHERPRGAEPARAQTALAPPPAAPAPAERAVSGDFRGEERRASEHAHRSARADRLSQSSGEARASRRARAESDQP